MTLPRAEILLEILDGAGLGVALMDSEGRFRYVNERLARMNGPSPEEHIGRPLDEVLPALAPRLRRLIEQAVSSGDPVVFAGVTGSTGTMTGAWDTSYVPVALEGEPGVGVLVLETTKRERAIAETRRRLSQQEGLADLTHLGLTTADPDVVHTAATRMLVRELKADLSGVMRLDRTSGRLVLAAGTGFPPGATQSVVGDVGPKSGAGYTLMVDEVVICEDATSETRFEFAPPLLALGIRSSISVPIPGGAGPFGVLAAMSRRPVAFDAHDGTLLRAAANVLGATVVRAEHEAQVAGLAATRGRLVAEALDTGEREQRHLADVLHEDVLQHILFARLELASLGADERDKGRVTESLDAATQLVRELVGSLRPVTLSHAGLAAALEALCLQMQKRTGLRTDVNVEPACEGVADDLVHSAVRELLSHIATHAGARYARVVVGAYDGGVEILVAQDGEDLGADGLEAAMRGENIGLTALHERVVALNGKVDVTAGLGGRGTAVELRLPG